MNPASFRTRGVNFAYLIGPPKTLSREDATELHGAVCDALGVDDFAFQYSSQSSGDTETSPGSGSSRGFTINLERQQGRGSFKIVVDNQNVNQPVRILVQYTWPPSRQHAFQDIDDAVDAVLDTLGPQWERVLAEARVRGQLEAAGGSASEYLAERVLGFGEEARNRLEAPMSFVSIGYETPPGDPTPDDALRRPKRQVSVEVLREDERSLYVELMSQWQQVAQGTNGTLRLDAQRIRQFHEPPSAYLRDSVAYVQEVVLPLFSR